MSNEQDHRLALKSGTGLQGKYKIERVLGSGGFGITYLAHDVSLGRRVAIKEMLPNDFATRGADSSVVPKTRGDASNLEWALQRFVEEARVLAKFDHPSIVRIHEQFRANQTAYMVTAYEEGRELNDYLREVGLLDLDRCAKLLLPVLDGLNKVHAAGILHRDIKPGNLYISSTTDLRPVLLDFGSARLTIGAKTKDITTIVTPNYAPFEQYHTTGNLGPWTDIYSMAAVMHKGITGSAPPEAPKRERNDPYVPLAGRVPHLPTDFLAAVDWALKPLEIDRPQSIDEWREQIEPTLSECEIGGRGGAPGVSGIDRTRVVDSPTRPSGRITSGTPGSRPVSGRIADQAPRTVYTSELGNDATSIPTERRGGRSRVAASLLIGALAAGLTGFGVYQFRDKKTKGEPVRPKDVSRVEPDIPDVAKPPTPPSPPEPEPQNVAVAKAEAGRQVMALHGNLFDGWQIAWERADAQDGLDFPPSILETEEEKEAWKKRTQLQIDEFDKTVKVHVDTAQIAAAELSKLPKEIVLAAFGEKKLGIGSSARKAGKSPKYSFYILDIAQEFYEGRLTGVPLDKDDFENRALTMEPGS